MKLAEQIPRGNFPSSGRKQKAWHKKIHRRTLRRVPLDETPSPNRYHDWAD